MNDIIINRRSFIFGISAATVGAAISFSPTIKSLENLFNQNNEINVLSPNIWVSIDADNTITVVNSRQEMGQGTRTTMAMILAEELEADWKFVKVIQAPGDSKFGSQSTGGSQSVRTMYNTLRYAGATAKLMLITAASQLWGISKSQCYADKSFIYETGGSRKISFGDLVEKASSLPVPPQSEITLKDPSKFNIIGKNFSHIDNTDIVNGKAIYGFDKKLPNMKYAVIVRPPSFGGSLLSYDDKDCLKVEGVIKVLRIGSSIAVIGDNSWAALKGADALSIFWSLGNNQNYSSNEISKSLYDKIGNLDSLPSSTIKSIQSIYEVPFMAHSTMEPQTATAWYHDGIMDVWSSTQDPQSVKSNAASSAQISSSNVNSYPLLAGGGFGRRLGGDYAGLAAAIAKQVNYPVKLFFTKTDDLQNDYYRPASIHAMKGGIDSDGNITGWIHKGVYAGNGSAFSPPYKLPNPKNTTASGLSFVPTGAWRSVDNTQVVFANECFIDELAFLAGKDPFDFRLNLITDTRLKNIFILLKEKAKWDAPLPFGWGKGVASFVGYGGYIAHCIFVSLNQNSQLKVEKIVAVVDPGTAINPKNIEAQIMGAAIDGLSTALKAEITISFGGVKQSNWHDFEWLRMSESPIIEVYIAPNGSSPSGMGEVGFPSVTPALCNAIFNACGIRVYKLPISKTELKLGVSEIEKKTNILRVYPNPSNNILNIEVDSILVLDKKSKIEILNIIGKSVFSEEIMINTKSVESIDISNLTSGVYFIKLAIGKDEFISRFIKE